MSPGDLNPGGLWGNVREPGLQAAAAAAALAVLISLLVLFFCFLALRRLCRMCRWLRAMLAGPSASLVCCRTTHLILILIKFERNFLFGLDSASRLFPLAEENPVFSSRTAPTRCVTRCRFCCPFLCCRGGGVVAGRLRLGGFLRISGSGRLQTARSSSSPPLRRAFKRG